MDKNGLITMIRSSCVCLCLSEITAVSSTINCMRTALSAVVSLHSYKYIQPKEKS